MTNVTRLQLRRGIASDWALRNEILKQGEPGLEIDTGKMKYGNGTSHWNDLPYSINSDTVSDISISALSDVSITDPLQDKQNLVYDNDNMYWTNKTVNGGAVISDTTPLSPNNGDLWYDSDSGLIFVYYDDGTSSQWIEILASAVQESAPLGNLEDISDVNATGVVNGNSLVFDAATANWVASKDTDVIKMNAQTISANYSIPVGYNGMSAGPITISSGVVVTIPAGSSWSIV